MSLLNILNNKVDFLSVDYWLRLSARN